MTANPVAVKKGANVTFTPQWSSGRPTAPDIWNWQWTADHPPGATANCFYYEDPCTKPVQETGSMKVQLRPNGVIRYASARAIVYTSFTLDADQTIVLQGDTVTFTPKYDGVAGPAARWRWIPVDTTGDGTSCAAGVQDCVKAIFESGTMWAYTATSGGDSASKYVTVVLAGDSIGTGVGCSNAIRSRRSTRPRVGNGSRLEECGTSTEWRCGGALPDQRDSLRLQYLDIKTRTDTIPDCGDFMYHATTNDFGWAVVQSHAKRTAFDPYFDYAILRDPLRNGINVLHADTAFAISVDNRFYSTPHHNWVIDSSLHLNQAPNSRHVYGDGVDIDTQSQVAWLRLFSLADSIYLTQPDTAGHPCAEPYEWAPSHLHVDFRKAPTAFRKYANCGSLLSVTP